MPAPNLSTAITRKGINLSVLWLNIAGVISVKVYYLHDNDLFHNSLGYNKSNTLRRKKTVTKFLMQQIHIVYFQMELTAHNPKTTQL